ncbi:protein FAM174C [Discoglossus pictus]
MCSGDSEGIPSVHVPTAGIGDTGYWHEVGTWERRGVQPIALALTWWDYGPGVLRLALQAYTMGEVVVVLEPYIIVFIGQRAALERMLCSACILVIWCLAESLVESGNVTNTTATPHMTQTTKVTMKGTLLGLDSEMLRRAFYVLIGISVLTVLYFIIRAVRLKKKPQKKKYGLLSDYDDNMEMGSLESDEEKIFEARNIRR